MSTSYSQLFNEEGPDILIRLIVLWLITNNCSTHSMSRCKRVYHVRPFSIKSDVNLFKHWTLGALDWGHNLWSHDCITDTWFYPHHCRGSYIIIWILETREKTSLLPALILISQVSCIFTSLQWCESVLLFSCQMLKD